jgi:hypothetical protein
MGTSLEDVALIIEGDKATVSKANPVAEALAEKNSTVVGETEHIEKSG